MGESVRGIYVFHGSGGKFASAVYESLDQATKSIAKLGMSGLLTWYPIGFTVYEYSTDMGFFKGRSREDVKFIQRFTSASLEHYHFEGGVMIE